MKRCTLCGRRGFFRFLAIQHLRSQDGSWRTVYRCTNRRACARREGRGKV